MPLPAFPPSVRLAVVVGEASELALRGQGQSALREVYATQRSHDVATTPPEVIGGG
jgi:hypothetical protein